MTGWAAARWQWMPECGRRRGRQAHGRAGPAGHAPGLPHAAALPGRGARRLRGDGAVDAVHPGRAVPPLRHRPRPAPHPAAAIGARPGGHRLHRHRRRHHVAVAPRSWWSRAWARSSCATCGSGCSTTSRPCRWRSSTPSRPGRLVARMTSDMDALQELVQQGLVMFVTNGLLLLFSVVVLVVLSPLLAVVCLIALPVVIVASVRFQRSSNKAYLVVRDRIGQTLSTLQEGISGVRVIQAFGREDVQVRRFSGTTRPSSTPTCTPPRSRPSTSRSSSWPAWPPPLPSSAWAGCSCTAATSPSAPSPPSCSTWPTCSSRCSSSASCSTWCSRRAPPGQAVRPARHAAPTVGADPAPSTCPATGALVGPRRRVQLRRGAPSARRRRPRRRPRRAAGPGRPDGRRQVDAGQAAGPPLRPDRGRHHLRRHRPPRRHAGSLARAHRASCPRRATCSAAPSSTTCASAAWRPPTTRWPPPCAYRHRRSGSPRCPRAWPPRCASAARACRPASASSSRWPGPPWPTRRCSCSTRPRPASTPAPRPTSRRP